MAVRSQHRVLNDMAHDFAARQQTGIDLLPIGQQLTRGLFIAHVQGVANGGEMVTELAKTQRHIQNQHAPDKSQQAVHAPQEPVDAESQQRRQQHRQGPGQPAMLLATGVQVATAPARPGAHTRMQRIAR